MTELKLKQEMNKVWDCGSDTKYEYDSGISKLVGQHFDQDTAQIAKGILNDCLDNDKDTAYASFYCLNYYYRHQFNNKELNKLWTDYAEKFEDKYKSLNHLDVLRFLDNLNLAEDFDKQLEYLELALENININNKNAGYLHAFASLYISIYEKNESDPERIKKLRENNWSNLAINMVREGIRKYSNSAVFYCTLGRILSSENKTKEAEEQLNIAIFMEDPSRHDYALRISQYQYYRLLNQTRIHTHKIQKALDSNGKAMDEMNNQIAEDKATVKKMNDQIAQDEEAVQNMKDSILSNIESIGIFSGIVALVIGSLEIASNFSAIEAGLLILILACSLTSAFSGFSLLLHLGDQEKKKIPIFIILFSLLILIDALFAIKYWI